MDEIRTALVGLGPRALRTWLPLLERIEVYRIVAVCDPIAELHEPALALLKRRGEVRTYRHLDEVLGDPDVDAVALTVRSGDQGALAARALRAGMHVHAEVPAGWATSPCARASTSTISPTSGWTPGRGGCRRSTTCPMS